ncbi:MAG TPA: DUF542 domain-containing protein [Gemmatimonadaceae bacterium]|nr:DUF542 domain-containing protein [Gemmatimonadaceae bacterium]
MLTLTADHAVRALLTLARFGGERPLRVEEIAERTGAPRNYLGKTLNVLVKEGLLRSARGPTGGFSLAVPAAQITVSRVADLFSEARSHPRCLMGSGPCDPAHPCGAHDRWSAMTSNARSPLERTTLAELLPPEPILMADSIAPTWTVNETLLRHPETVLVFNRHGVDSCCGGEATLADAARDAALPLETLLDELTDAARAAEGEVA